MNDSLKHLPYRAQEELRVLLELIHKSGANCQMIILYGSYARGGYVLWDEKVEFGIHTSYQSDFDLLVITTGAIRPVEARMHSVENKYHHIFDGLRHTSPQIIVEHINTVNNNLEISQYFFTDIVKEGVILYDSGKCQLAKPRKLSFKEIRDIAQSEYEKLYPYGCEFLDGVKEYYLPKNINNIAAFLLHQACEKLYNTILLVFTNYRPKTHKIEDFYGMTKRFSMELPAVFPQSTPDEKVCFDLLCRAYIEARYNKDYKISREQLEYIISRIEILKELTERLCREKIAEYDSMIEED